MPQQQVDKTERYSRFVYYLAHSDDAVPKVRLTRALSELSCKTPLGRENTGRIKKEPVVGIEPTADALRKHCSTAELHRRESYLAYVRSLGQLT